MKISKINQYLFYFFCLVATFKFLTFSWISGAIWAIGAFAFLKLTPEIKKREQSLTGFNLNKIFSKNHNTSTKNKDRYHN